MSWLARLMPRSPAWTLTLLVAWLLLNGVSVGQALLGLLLGLILPRLAAPLASGTSPPQRLLLAARLAALVLIDIVRANVTVARQILGDQTKLRPGYVWLPLDVRHPMGINALAGIITSTPGTVSCELSPDARWLLVHCLHVTDPDAVVAEIKARYEAPLREIFR